MEIVKLKPACKDYIWGGDLLKKWGKESESPTIAECWELSFNPSGPSVIASGKETGKLLMDVATKEDIGEVPASFAFFFSPVPPLCLSFRIKRVLFNSPQMYFFLM